MEIEESVYHWMNHQAVGRVSTPLLDVIGEYLNYNNDGGIYENVEYPVMNVFEFSIKEILRGKLMDYEL